MLLEELSNREIQEKYKYLLQISKKLTKKNSESDKY